MTDGPFVYGIELRDPPTAPTELTQYDLLFGPGSLLYRPPNSMAGDYGDELYGTNLSLALGELLRDNISATVVGTHNLSGNGRSAAGNLPPATGTGTAGSRGGDGTFQNQLIIPLYAIIFLLSVVGNLLVILTLAQNKRMRTVTNVYLLNLAISDLLLGVFCMPFTLAGQVLRRFVFGSVMCKLIPYFQAVSVSVAVWTLVAISLERYFAICRPLSSRRWQTQFHAYKMIGLVWTVSFLANSPLGYVQRLLPVGRSTGQMKCREEWPSPAWEKAYVLFHDVGLLFLPLLTMGFAYSMIVSKLWRGLRHEIKHSSLYQQTSRQHGTGGQGSSVGGAPTGAAAGKTGQGDCDPSALNSDPAYQFSRHAIRSTYMDKSIEAKKKVIRMLFVIIVEFFVCWAPLHILNTVYLYSPTFVYQYVNSSGIALVQLMAYISSCCNPITYCFMNRRFRQAFLGVFSCYRNRMPICCCFCCASSNGPMEGAESKAAAYLRQNTINQSGAERNNSDMSGNDSLVYVGRGLVQRSGKLCARRSGTYPRYYRDAVCNALPWDLKM
ncbi:AGAP001022-PB [Anopheles gambiae str. PEST]|uniref:AGAP001022-PB n=1 Tax=Anopheles gambiae TaxID=7165 RepID=Q7QHX9_ANOGA|nr:AGAP001022-PB [Anopheles gambiae str. PEST]